MVASKDSEFGFVHQSPISNKGFYAIKDLAKKTLIIQYKGQRIPLSKVDERLKEQIKNNLILLFYLCDDDYNPIACIDASVNGNDAKYINHSCNPNCEPKYFGDEIWLLAKKDIKAGDELTYNYSFTADIAINFPCNCKSDNCRKYIVDKDEIGSLNNLLRNKMK